jgi:hypothetical protein
VEKLYDDPLITKSGVKEPRSGMFRRRTLIQAGIGMKQQGKEQMKKTYDFSSVPKEIGKGAFGQVVVTHSVADPGFKVAVKIMNKASYSINLEYLDDEIAILNSLDHPNIVNYLEKYEDEDDVCLIMEYIKGTSL